jgi:hypothetical protein
MAIRVTTGQSTVRAVVTGSQTTVKKVTVGTPVRIVRRIAASDFELGSLDGIDLTGVTDGATLIYNSATENFESKVEISNTNTTFNGGNF